MMTKNAHPLPPAQAHFMQMLRWIALAGVIMTVGALALTALISDLTPAVVAAVIGGVFVSVVLGCGLFAAAFFSDRSGHDAAVTYATPGARGARYDTDFTAGTGPSADEIAACEARGYCPRCL
jgi:hypothetical protein